MDSRFDDITRALMELRSHLVYPAGAGSTLPDAAKSPSPWAQGRVPGALWTWWRWG